MDVTKEAVWEAAVALKPDYRPEAFDRHWDEFMALKARAEKLKAQGIAIHPNFGTLCPPPVAQATTAPQDIANAPTPQP